MKLEMISVVLVAFGLAACSGGSEERAPAGAQTPGEVSSDIQGQRIVSQRDATGGVRAQLFDRATLAATLALDANGRGTLALASGGAPAAVSIRADTPLEEVNRGFHDLWAIESRASGATPLRAECWSSDSTGYCASSGYADCSNSCGGASYYYLANAAGCICSC